MDPQYGEALSWGYGAFALVALVVGSVAVRALFPLDRSLMKLAEAPHYVGPVVVGVALVFMLAASIGRLRS